MKRLTVTLAPLFMPSIALASTTTDILSELAGLFYIMVGVALATAILLMAGGFAMWCARLGTYPTHRDEAIGLMEWAVSTLFALVVVLGVAEFVQTHTDVVLYLIVLAVTGAILWLLTSSGGEKKEEKKEEH